MDEPGNQLHVYADGAAETLSAAIAAWGDDHQTDLAIEECAELITAIRHWKRGRCTVNKVAEEVADVMLLTQEMRSIVGPDLVDEWVEMKLHRLKRRIEEHNGTEKSGRNNSNGR